MTFKEKYEFFHKILVSVEIPDSASDHDESVLAEDTLILELAAPAIASSDGEVAAPLVKQDNYKLNPNTFLSDLACSSDMGGCDASMFVLDEEE